MATVGITPDQDAVTADIFIAAPPERVFQAARQYDVATRPGDGRFRAAAHDDLSLKQ